MLYQYLKAKERPLESPYYFLGAFPQSVQIICIPYHVVTWQFCVHSFEWVKKGTDFFSLFFKSIKKMFNVPAPGGFFF